MFALDARHLEENSSWLKDQVLCDFAIMSHAMQLSRCSGDKTPVEGLNPHNRMLKMNPLGYEALTIGYELAL